MLSLDRSGRIQVGYTPAVLAISLVLFWCPALAVGGMGDIVIGAPDSAGNLSGNPAAVAASGVRFDEGLVRTEISWLRMAFAGSAFNPSVAERSDFDVFSGLQLSAVTPQIKAGRIGVGMWQLERRVLELEEPLDLTLSFNDGFPVPLSGTFEDGWTELRQSEETYALGAVWMQDLPGGSVRAALGGAYVTHAQRGLIDTTGFSLVSGEREHIFRLASRRKLDGLGIMAGIFYRPLPDWSLGVSFMHLGSLSGNICEQADGAPLYRDQLTRPAQERVGFGGSVVLMTDLIVSAEIHYLTGIDMTATIFTGTPAQTSFREKSETTIDARLGAQYPVKIGGIKFPLRAGFFMQPDAMPAQTAGIAVTAVSQFRPVSFIQDVMGWSLGGTWEADNLRVDLSLFWLQVNTHVKQQGPTGWVDSADARNSLGASAGVTLRFGGIQDGETP